MKMDMLQKSNRTLGLEIESILNDIGQQTPYSHNGLSSTEKISKISIHFKEIMEILGLDLSDDSLRDTPNRVAKMYVDELFNGLDPANFPKCTTIDNKIDYDEMILVRDVKLLSSCEHHFVTIDGLANVAYIPKNKVLGLSKINRIVNYFSRRPQVQERLTHQIFHCLSHILGTDDVAVVIDATHYCVKARGVEDSSSHTLTSKLGGIFRSNSSTRAEFFSLLKNYSK
jgi:GTP cyclohydrolase IA